MLSIGSQQVIDLFDLNTSAPTTQSDDQDEVLDNWKDFHRRATPNAPIDQHLNGGEERSRRSSGKGLLSGHSYKVYDWKASEDELPEELCLVMQAVAEAIGVQHSAVLKELHALEGLVESASRKVAAEVRREKRRRGSSLGGGPKSELRESSGASSFGDASD